MAVSVNLTDVQKRYGTRVIFRGFSAIFQGPGCHCVTGDNGTGKSTLLALLSKIYMPDMGAIYAEENGILLSDEVYRSRIGVVSPKLKLYDSLTAAENVAFFAGVRGASVCQDAIEEVLIRVGLENRGGEPTENFSTGMKQRLKFAVLLASGADIWLLDEPSSNMDRAGCRFVETEVRRGVERGFLIVLATNDPAEVRYGETVCRLG